MNRLTHSAGQVWFRSQGFGAGHTGGTAQPNPAGTGPDRPGPSGWRLGAAHFVRRLARCPASPGTVFRVKRAAIRQQHTAMRPAGAVDKKPHQRACFLRGNHYKSLSHSFARAVSSVVEHYVDIVGVTSSNLVPPTISFLTYRFSLLSRFTDRVLE